MAAKTEKRRIRPERTGGTALYEAISAMPGPDDAAGFMSDLCTPHELAALEQRFAVACRISAGMTYAAITAETGASSAIISRVSRAMNGGTGVLEAAARTWQPEKQEKAE